MFPKENVGGCAKVRILPKCLPQKQSHRIVSFIKSFARGFFPKAKSLYRYFRDISFPDNTFRFQNPETLTVEWCLHRHH